MIILDIDSIFLWILLCKFFYNIIARNCIMIWHKYKFLYMLDLMIIIHGYKFFYFFYGRYDDLSTIRNVIYLCLNNIT